jgi:hypothetical protein
MSTLGSLPLSNCSHMLTCLCLYSILVCASRSAIAICRWACQLVAAQVALLPVVFLFALSPHDAFESQALVAQIMCMQKYAPVVYFLIFKCSAPHRNY